jgi:uncharacterized protein with von Willebrand factor type A (vWA) domain
MIEEDEEEIQEKIEEALERIQRRAERSENERARTRVLDELLPTLQEKPDPFHVLERLQEQLVELAREYDEETEVDDSDYEGWNGEDIRELYRILTGDEVPEEDEEEEEEDEEA